MDAGTNVATYPHHPSAPTTVLSEVNALVDKGRSVREAAGSSRSARTCTGQSSPPWSGI